MKDRPVGVDVFCGAGGMSLGFEQAGFDVVAAVDIDPIHVAAYERNFPQAAALQADASIVSGDDIRSQARLGKRNLDVVFGGPPCGGYSTMGHRNPEDPRNGLLIEFARLVLELEPNYFVLENVEGLLLEPMTQYLEDFKRRLSPSYLAVEPIRTLDASQFGVPQRRRRVFILGYKRNLVEPKYPTPLSGRNPSHHPPTVWNAIGDLSRIDSFEDLVDGHIYNGHLPRTESRYARILRGELHDPEDHSYARDYDPGSLAGCGKIEHSLAVSRRFRSTEPGTRESVSKFYRLTVDGIAPTLRAGTDVGNGAYSAARPIHPVDPRCITVREGARLHSFPDWFEFHATKWHGFRQLGNSVPPLLARAVAKSILHATRIEKRR